MKIKHYLAVAALVVGAAVAGPVGAAPQSATESQSATHWPKPRLVGSRGTIKVGVEPAPWGAEREVRVTAASRPGFRRGTSWSIRSGRAVFSVHLRPGQRLRFRDSFPRHTGLHVVTVVESEGPDTANANFIDVPTGQARH